MSNGFVSRTTDDREYAAQVRASSLRMLSAAAFENEATTNDHNNNTPVGHWCLEVVQSIEAITMKQN